MNYLPEISKNSINIYLPETPVEYAAFNQEEPYVLLIDDDPVLGKVMFHALKQQGIKLKVIADGQTAVKMLNSSSKPSLIILDLILPIYSGYEVLNQIRSTPGWKNLPVIVSSSNYRQEDIDKAFDRGATDYLMKPINFSALCDRIICYTGSVEIQQTAMTGLW